MVHTKYEIRQKKCLFMDEVLSELMPLKFIENPDSKYDGNSKYRSDEGGTRKA